MSKTLSPKMAATVRASNKGLELVDKARCKKGWAKTCQTWAGLANTSQATLRRFWAGLKIQPSAFQAICETVGIEAWESIIDFDSTDDSPPKAYSKRLSFAIAGSIEEIDKHKLDAIVALLRKLGGDADIEILDINEGSIKLVLGGSEESLQRLQELFDSGELQEVEGLLVQNVHFLTKEEIIELIRYGTSLSQNLNKVDLSWASLRNANLNRANLNETNLNRADLREVNLSRANLNEADLSWADLSGADLSWADLIRADLNGTNLSEANLIRANLSEADIRWANLSGADLNGTNLSEANLIRANLSEADIRWANLSGADLNGTNLSGAIIRWATIRGTNLSGADLNGTDLSRAIITGGNLSGVDISKAVVRQARFANTRGISIEDRALLIEKGAIFEDGPNTHDRALVLS